MSWLFGAVTAALPVMQSSNQHQESIAQSSGLHRQAIEQAAWHHKQAMSHDTELARRESLRDIWGQKNQKTQTLMIVDTLMFGCGFALVVEGIPPENTSSGVLVLFAASLALALGFLFLSVWFSMLLQNRMTKYVISDQDELYVCGDTHPTFRSYYRCHCATIAGSASFFFYIGTGALMFTASVLLWARFDLQFNTPTAGIVFTALSATCVLSLFVLGCVFPMTTRMASDEPSPRHSGSTLSSHSLKLLPIPGERSVTIGVQSDNMNGDGVTDYDPIV
eukprot:260239_1